METKIEIKSVKGRVLFEYTTEGNTLAKTVERAIHDEISLHGAYLQGAFLGGANLWKADLEDADLSYANLQKVNLYGANLSKANLSYVNLTDTDLWDANLQGANLRGANLRGTDLWGANLQEANLCLAHMFGANLYKADLRNAVLCGALLNDVCLYGADLDNANLRYTNLYDVNLLYAYLDNVKNLNVPMDLPEGEFIAWKKLQNGLIAKLKILEDSKRSRATGKKCRCDKALVLEFQYEDRHKADVQTYTSTAYENCTYTVGEVVYADSWDENRWNECSHGIHFFINRQDAVDY